MLSTNTCTQGPLWKPTREITEKTKCLKFRCLKSLVSVKLLDSRQRNYATVHSPDRRSPCTIYHVRATRPSFAFTPQLARYVGCGDGDGDGTGGMDAAEEGVVGATPLAGGLLALVPVGQISN